MLTVGQELPSTRALAALQSINPMIVSKAHAELERVLQPAVKAARQLEIQAMDACAVFRRLLAEAEGGGKRRPRAKSAKGKR